MNKSILSLLICGGLIFSTLVGQAVQAQGFSFPAEMNKSFRPLSIGPGETSRLQVTVYNPNPFDLTNAGWTDNLTAVQPGIFIANPVNLTNTCGGTVTAVPGGTTLSLSNGMVPAQAGAIPGSCTVSVDVTSVTAGNLINTIPAGALSSTGENGPITNTTPASATLHVSLIRAPSVNKSFSPNTILVGQTSQVTVRIRNNDTLTALTQTSITDALPADVAVANPPSVSLSGCGDSASVTAGSGSSSITLNGASIAPNSTCTIQVDVTSSESGVYTNSIPADSVQTQQGVTNVSPATANLNVQGVGLSKAFSPPAFQAGATTTLTITLRNPTSSAYTGVQLSDTLPGDVLTVVPDSASTTCGGSVSITPPRTVSLNGGRIPAGTPSTPGTCTITVQVTTPEDASGETYTNTIPEGELVTDQGITNVLPASARVQVYRTGAGISAGKSFSPSTISPGANSRLRINITAPADTDLTNFSLTDNLPPNVTVSNSSPATHNNCGASAVITAETGAVTITLTNGTIRAGATCQINVYVTSSTAGVHTNVVQPTDISNNENRTIPNNITANLTVEAVSSLEIGKSFTPPTVNPGGISTLRIILENRNDRPLVDVSLTDPLPGDQTNGILVAPTPNASTTCEGGTIVAEPGTQTISMTGGTVPAQVGEIPGTCTIRVDVQGLGTQTTRTNTIPVANVSGTLEGTDTVIRPSRPAQANLIIGNLSIGVVKGFDPLTVFGGSASTLSIELVNPNNVEVSGVSFTDNMPAGMVVADPVNPSVGECGGTLNGTPGENSFTYSGGSVAAASSCFLTLRVTMTVNGNLTNVIEAGALTTFAGVTNPDPAEASLTNLPGASITKSFSPNPIRAGSVARLTFTLRNTGSVALSGMGFRDVLPGDLPVGLEIAESPAPVNECGGTLTAVPGTQLIELSNGALDLNSTCTITVSVTGNIAGSFTNTIEPGTLITREGATNHDPTSDTLVITDGSSGGGDDDDGGGSPNEPAPTTPGVSGFIIPVTGFSPNVVTALDERSQPSYQSTSIRIEIPVIKLSATVAGVGINKGGWDVSWLQDQVGWLNGTAYPTRKGNSVLTAHVINADGKPGTFARLKHLGVGEFIYIYTAGYRYIYRVESNQLVDPDAVSVFRHEDQAYLTLITCEQYDENLDSYLQRVAVRAELVDTRPIK
ncbi:MAG TPA: class F sortase [Anaerolineales bacterium]|nr:class F sortase [Anaerolineales bacterium]